MYYQLLVARYSSAVLPSRESYLWREANRWELGEGEQKPVVVGWRAEKGR